MSSKDNGETYEAVPLSVDKDEEAHTKVPIVLINKKHKVVACKCGKGRRILCAIKVVAVTSLLVWLSMKLFSKCNKRWEHSHYDHSKWSNVNHYHHPHGDEGMWFGGSSDEHEHHHGHGYHGGRHGHHGGHYGGHYGRGGYHGGNALEMETTEESFDNGFYDTEHASGDADEMEEESSGSWDHDGPYGGRHGGRGGHHGGPHEFGYENFSGFHEDRSWGSPDQADAVVEKDILSSLKNNLKWTRQPYNFDELDINLSNAIKSSDYCSRRHAMARVAGLISGASVETVNAPDYDVVTEEVMMGSDDGFLTFVPKKTTICKDDSVKWININPGPAGQNVSFDVDTVPSGFDAKTSSMNGNLKDKGDTFTLTFELKGEYGYYSEPYRGAGMTGSIYVN